MAKQKVKVGQEVKNTCPVCGKKEVETTDYYFTPSKLRTTKRIMYMCLGCDTDFWFNLRTGKITVKKIDKSYVD